MQISKNSGREGIENHAGKTKIMTNVADATTQQVPVRLKVDNEAYEVLGFEDSMNFLGRKVCYKDPQEVELNNRVAKAWGAFSKMS